MLGDQSVLLPRTLILLDEPYVEVGGRYHTAFSWWRFAEKFAAHCRSSTLYVPLERRTETSLPAAPLARLRVVGRPYYERIKGYYRRLPFIHRALRRQARELVATHDLLVIRVPAPCARYAVREAARTGKPVVMLVAGDVKEQSAWVVNQRGPIAWAGHLLTTILRRQERAYARRCVFVGAWGETLRRVFLPDCPRVEVCQDPNIEAGQLARRADTCQTSPVRLLRVCRLLPSKGLEYLLEAVAQLAREGLGVRLDIAGGGDEPSYEQSLRDRAAQLGIADAVVFHGPVPYGEKLFALFRAADIHVISSLSEGLPRIIAEGRAFSLPTVGTTVGGIPDVIHDGEDGLLVPPADAQALARAIRRLIDDAPLRRRIVARSYEVAQRSTAEYHAERLARLIADAIAASQAEARA